ncbi:hypothetical protein BaRGS_00019020 [Batillaria attramentaria]|uniref:THAP-type domain-containing protein n=1 Tax=Batillaria attramentaria TaxID=370345 RepID=A0ABD0KS85_9CAEN
MVNSCCVKDCYNIQKPGRENDRRYFQVPAVVCGKGEETFQLTSRRRREWLAQLKLKGLTFESTSRRFVCSDHFVSGVPAYLRDVNAPNWKPTLKLGHSDSVTPNSDRYERLRGRQSAGNDYSTSQFGESEEVLMQHDGGAEGFCNAGR